MKIDRGGLVGMWWQRKDCKMMNMKKMRYCFPHARGIFPHTTKVNIHLK